MQTIQRSAFLTEGEYLREVRRVAQLAKYERLVRRMRQRIFQYEDAGRLDQASRVLSKAITRMVAAYPPKKRDQWGFTADERRALARHGGMMLS